TLDPLKGPLGAIEGGDERRIVHGIPATQHPDSGIALTLHHSPSKGRLSTTLKSGAEKAALGASCSRPHAVSQMPFAASPWMRSKPPTAVTPECRWAWPMPPPPYSHAI